MNGISVGLFITALALSTVSAYYSIVGLAAIFAASFWPVLILATTLEVGKLVMVSWLYRNWPETPWPIRTYMTVAVIILMLITSLGIFGFLSKAHSQDQVQAQQVQLQVSQINNQIDVRQQQLSQSREVVEQLNRSINIQLDANRPQQALINRRQQTAERERVQARMDQLQTEILQLNDQKGQLQSVRNVQDSKLGPVRYVVALVNPDADPESAVKWIILVLVIVCDPLAVCMLMAANQRTKNQSLGHSHIPTPVSHAAVKWDPAHNKLLISDEQGVWHVFPQSEPAPVAKDATVTDTVKVVELAVAELIKQRPIWEVMTTSYTPPRSHVIHTPDHTPEVATPVSTPVAPMPVMTPEAVDPQALQKLIEHTLEAWMNKTLTVTYSADQTEIEQIVQKVIEKTMHKSEPEAEPATEVETVTQSDPVPDPEPESDLAYEPPVVTLTQYTPEEVPSEKEAEAPSNRPIYNYFGEERIRGGKKHIPTT